MTSESDLQVQVADFLRLHYPDVLFHSDFGSGIKLTVGQAAKQKRQNGGRRAWPDMFIAQAQVPEANVRLLRDNEKPVVPPFVVGAIIEPKYGLFLELKKEGTRLVKARDPDEWASDHIAEQAEILRQLRARGYAAEFAVGFEQAKEIIENYLGKPKQNKVEF